MSAPATPTIDIACGGTGGHLFPGMAVAEILREQDCLVRLLISAKEVDQSAARSHPHLEYATLPAVGLARWGWAGFLKGFWRSYRALQNHYAGHPPAAVLAMGGFTSAPAVLAARACGAATFLHEANSIPGRANRWLAPWVEEVFVCFPESARRLRHRRITVTGMPVRAQFQAMDTEACRVMLGLDPRQPVLLIMGGSQGASAINEWVTRTLPVLVKEYPQLQYLHLSGLKDEARVKAAYAALPAKAIVRPFLTEMELAMNAATAAISRAGASSLAELAALGLPALLIPYPAAADNHQHHNARQFVEAGAGLMLEQAQAHHEVLRAAAATLVFDGPKRAAMREALARWHKPRAAADVASHLLASLKRGAGAVPVDTPGKPGNTCVLAL